jgi:hypothetical protein
MELDLAKPQVARLGATAGQAVGRPGARVLRGGGAEQGAPRCGPVNYGRGPSRHVPNKSARDCIKRAVCHSLLPRRFGQVQILRPLASASFPR